MRDDVRWKQRFENFQKAVVVFERRVIEYRKKPTDEALQLALVQAYEFTFELAWKTMKDYLEMQGYDGIVAPKEIIRQAFQSKVIQQGGLWLDALKSRNETSHVYADFILKKVVKFADEKFLTLVLEFNHHFETL